ncbi:MAG: hypothetical protein IPI00_07100 [Flavobacteriales bacterium]|nr:hypothetical protein [Flavobacteriales bacterium]HQX37449.1 TssN family type VI secretion system protein [Flavobacteriales bacterium]
MQKGLGSKVKQAKGAQAKAAKFNSGIVKHLLVFLLLGSLLGLTVFLPYYQFDGFFATPAPDGTVPKLNMVRVVFTSLSIIFLLIGIWHLSKAEKKVDWFDRFRLGPEFGLTLGFAFVAALGLFLMHRFGHLLLFWKTTPPNAYFEPMASTFALLFASTAIWFVVPFLVRHLYQRAMLVEDKQYPLWYFPKNHKEKEPVWIEPFVHLHMRFIPDRKQGSSKLIETKLPLQWNFGQGVYLFIEDYNEHRSPDAPIKELRQDDNSLGWLFSVPKKIGSIKIGQRYLDPELSVQENRIVENTEIRFSRIHRIPAKS